MPMICRACRHPDRDAVDTALVAGASTRDIAGRFSLSKSGVDRHQAHVQDTLRTAAERHGDDVAHDLLQDLEGLEAGLWGLMEDAEETDDIKHRLAVFRELRETMEFKARMVGAIAPSEFAMTVEQVPVPKAVAAVEEYLALVDQVVDEEVVRRVADDQARDRGGAPRPAPCGAEVVRVDFTPSADERVNTDEGLARSVRAAFAV